MRRQGGLRSCWTRRQKILGIALMAAITAFGVDRGYEYRRSHDAEHILNSVVMVVDENGETVGSGAILHDGLHVITVNHVIEKSIDNNKAIWVRYRNGEILRAKLVKRNRHFDIALLEMPKKSKDGLDIKSERLSNMGDGVITVGHPFGIPWMMSEGIISKKSYYPPGPDARIFVIWTTAWIESGNSGGPLISRDGKIIGLVMAYVNPRGVFLGAQHLNICVSGSEIIRFLEAP